MAARRSSKLRAFVKYDKNGDIIPGAMVLRQKHPGNGWVEIVANICCTTTTTSTSTTTTTTT